MALDTPHLDESDASQSLAQAGEQEHSFCWSVRLWNRDPRKLYGILAGCCFGAFVGWLAFHQTLFALMGFGAIAAATAEFWLPQRYRIDQKGVTVRCGISVSAIEWGSVKRAILDEEGVKLSPLEGNGKLSPFRGVYVRFGDRRDQILNAIEKRCGPVV